MKVNNKVKARVKIHHSFLLMQLSSVIMNVHKLYVGRLNCIWCLLLGDWYNGRKYQYF